MEADIACVGFGPAMGGFLTTLNRRGSRIPPIPRLRARSRLGMPLQVVCYERADDIAAGVSGVVTAARGIRASFPDLNPADIPMAARGEIGADSLSARPYGREPAAMAAAYGRPRAARA